MSTNECFRRNADGSWTCIAGTTFLGPNGRVQVPQGARFYPGRSFMGFDVARWLDERLDGRLHPSD
jgi:hypothetical protein